MKPTNPPPAYLPTPEEAVFGNAVLPFMQAKPFEDWLKTFYSSWTVGVARNTRECPLATFLTDKLHYNQALNKAFGERWHLRMSGDIVTIFNWRCDTSAKHRLPSWCDCFVEDVDNDREPGDPIHAATALTYLKQALDNSGDREQYGRGCD